MDGWKLIREVEEENASFYDTALCFSNPKH